MTVQERIRHFIVTNFFVASQAQLSDDASLLGEGVIDSTGVLEVIQFIESEFGIKVLDEEVMPDNLDGIARIARFVESKLAAQPAAS